jgi:drug/metabolite transporter (DMT)-like permease
MKMKNSKTLNLLLLHLIVFIWGFTGILGKEISLEALGLVWWRVLIAFTAIGLFAVIIKKDLRAPLKDIAKFCLVGFLTAAHWVCFFGSIKASNISVALVVISTTAFFVSLISPIIRKEKFYAHEVVLGCMVVAGLFVIFRFEKEYALGIFLSLCAAVLAATFSVFNSTFIVNHTSVKIAFWEMLSALVGLTIFLLLSGGLGPETLSLGNRDLWLLLVLGVICTGFAFVAGIEVMKVLSPFTCALSINMEPLYTIVFALMLYGSSEWMSPQFYLGAVIILSTLFLDIFLKRKFAAQKAVIEETNVKK